MPAQGAPLTGIIEQVLGQLQALDTQKAEGKVEQIQLDAKIKGLQRLLKQSEKDEKASEKQQTEAERSKPQAPRPKPQPAVGAEGSLGALETQVAPGSQVRPGNFSVTGGANQQTDKGRNDQGFTGLPPKGEQSG